jgi:hypothetical protein
MWSETIDYLLKQRQNILRVERVGSGMKTRYYSPIAGQVNNNAAAANTAANL